MEDTAGQIAAEASSPDKYPKSPDVPEIKDGDRDTTCDSRCGTFCMFWLH